MRFARRYWFGLFLIAALAAILTAPVLAQDEDEDDEAEAPPREKPVLRAEALTPGDRAGLRIDGRLDEAVWQRAAAIADLTQVEPEEGGETSGRTVVRVLTTPDEVIVGVFCEDDPAAITSFSKARDSDLSSEDYVMIVLDTFRDNRSGYVFWINPSGARYDGILTAEGDEANPNWDTVWEARTTVHESGWSAEVRIPIKSLSFAKGLDGWGMNIERRIQRLQEVNRWSGANQDYEVFQAVHAGLLTDLPEFDLGVGLTLQPSFVLRADRPESGPVRKYLGDVSLDAIQRLGPNLNATLTANTDFAETEVDVRQTNLGRFEILFPEKRKFFVEGSDIFEFGIGTDVDDANVIPFFSRRIGLFFGEEESDNDGREVPIIAGGKLNGRIGETNIGALIVGTDKVEEFAVDEQTMGSVRIRQNILTESSIGAIATFGDPLGRKNSWLAGADFVYRTSEFRDEKNLVAGVWGVTTDRDGLDGDKSAFGGSIAYPNDLIDTGITYLKIGDEFDPGLGFVQREGHVLETTFEYNPRPPWELVRQQFYAFDGFFSWLNDGRWQSYNAVFQPLGMQFESGDAIEASYAREGDRPDEPFDVFDSDTKTIIVDEGAYDWDRYGFAFNLAEKRKISGSFGASFGGFYEGDLESYEGSVVVRPMPEVLLAWNGERNVGFLPEGNFVQMLWGFRAELKLSPEFQVSNFLQYDNESRALGNSTRLRWTFHPLGDLFFSFNHNMLNRVLGLESEEEEGVLRAVDDGNASTTESWRFESDRVAIKVQYAFRM